MGVTRRGGTHFFLRNQESDGALCFQKILALDLTLDFGMGEEGVGTCKKYSQFGVSGKISHIYGPCLSKSGKDGAP